MMLVIIANTIKTVCHPQAVIIKLPAVGANNGEAPKINTSNEMIDALCFTGKKSLTIAIAATDATHPPIACTNRMIQRPSIVLIVKQPMVAMMYNIRPAYNGGFLPNLSSNGPYKICPIAYPKK